MRQPLAALVLAAVAAACGGGAARPTPSPTPTAKDFGDQVADTAWDTKVLGEASAAANDVVRNAADCPSVNPIIAEARAKLDAAEPRLRTVTGHATLATLKKQVAKVADLCAGT